MHGISHADDYIKNGSARKIQQEYLIKDTYYIILKNSSRMLTSVVC